MFRDNVITKMIKCDQMIYDYIYCMKQIPIPKTKEYKCKKEFEQLMICINQPLKLNLF
jgi:hypothetical protein